MAQYQYTISGDFANGIKVKQLQSEINARITVNLRGIERTGDLVKINFESALNEEESVLDTIIGEHIPEPGIYESLEFNEITAAESPYKLKKRSLKCDTSNGNITVNLPKAGRVRGGYYVIKKIAAAGSVVIDPYEEETIDGNTTKVVSTKNEAVVIRSNGTSWEIIQNATPISLAENNTRLTITDSKGEIAVDNGTELMALAIGNNGEFLQADNTTETGLKWANPTRCISSGLYTLTTGEKKIIEHTEDTSFKRLIQVYREDTEEIIDTTYNTTLRSVNDFTLTNATDTQINGVFVLKPTGSFSKGTTNLSLTGTSSASTSQQPSTNAHDNNEGTFWYNTTAEPPVGSWWMIDLGATKHIWGAQVVWYSTTYYATSVRFEGSFIGGTDANNWYPIKTFTGLTYGTGTVNLDFDNPVYYKYIRVVCVASANATFFIMKECRLWDVNSSSITYPLTGGTIINNTNEIKIDTAIWDTLTNVSVDGDIPTGTSMKFMFSFDNQSTWKYYDPAANGGSGGWTASALANINSVGMTKTDVESLNNTKIRNIGGLSDGNNLDFACYISTSDTQKTPVFAGLKFTASTAPYYENVAKSDLQIRLINSTKTSIKNNLQTSKFLVNIYA